MAISFSQRPKTPMRTYVVSGLLMSALGVSLGFGIYLMFNPDHSEYSAQSLEGTHSVETDQILISGLKKVVPMHHAPAGHHPTFGAPRHVDFHPATHAPISNNVPPPLVNQLPQTQPQHFNQFAPVMAPPSQYAPGAAGAAVPFHPVQPQAPVPMHPPVFDAPPALASTFPARPINTNQTIIPYSSAQGFRASKDFRLQMVTNR